MTDLKDLRLLFIGLDYLDFAKQAHTQGAIVHIVDTHFSQELYPLVNYPTFNLIIDDVLGWDKDWVLFERTRKHRQIDVIVSDMHNSLFSRIAPSLLTKSSDTVGLKKYYRQCVKMGEFQLWQ